MFVTKMLRVLNAKDWTILQRLNHVEKCTFKTNKQNDMHSVYKLLNCNRYLINLRAFNQLKTFSTEANCLPNEKLYARNVLEKSDHHSNSLVLPMSIEEVSSTDEIKDLIKKQWTSMSNAEILENFRTLSYYAFKQNKCVTDPEYQGIFGVLERHCTSFKYEELYHLLNCLTLWNNTKDKSDYKGFWKVLDEECLRRSSSWDLEKILSINDHFYKLRLTKYSKFTYSTLQNVDFKNMSPANLLHYIFLLRVNDKIPVNFKKLEYLLEKYGNMYTIEEMGIIAMAFFKHQSQFKSKQLVLLFINKLINNIETVGDISLSSILKILRYSIFLEIGQHFTLLLDTLVTQVPKRRLITLTHFAHIQGATLIHNSELIAQILDRYEKEIKTARIKDIERILFTLYIFAYDPKTTSFYAMAKDELLNPERKAECDTYPHIIVYSILYMMQMNFYPGDALKMIMHPNYIYKFCQGNYSMLNREYLFLDYSIDIEYPHYNGPRLSKSLRNSLVKKYGSGSITIKDNQRTKLLADVANSCEDLTNSKSAVYIDSLLPHFVMQNIVLCYDKNKQKFLNPKESLGYFLYHEIKYAPNDGKKWYALVMGTHNYLTRNTSKPTGLLTVHMRHLRLIGYIPVMIPYGEWQNILMDTKKQEYLKLLLDL